MLNVWAEVSTYECLMMIINAIVTVATKCLNCFIYSFRLIAWGRTGQQQETAYII